MKKIDVINRIDPLFLNGIAHRGMHNENITENGMNAFKEAIKNEVAFEFDIHLSKDNELIVCHDENLKRTTGKEGIIEDLSLKEIKDNYHLLDGGEIPTLKEVLELCKYDYPIVIELKVYRKNYKELANKLKEEIKNYKDKKKIMIISFDPRSLWPLKKEGYIRSLLVTKTDQYTWIFKRTVESVDLDKRLLKINKYRRYYKNHFTNCWTIENELDINEVINYSDTCTYQYIDKEIVKNKYLNKEKRG